jgi:hypothetical protein
LSLAGVACSSSVPIGKNLDAAAVPDLGAADLPARDALPLPDAAGPDLLGADLPSPDALLIVKDGALRDLPIADVSLAADTTIVDAPTADTVADVPATDVPVRDVLPADLSSPDGAVDRTPACTPGLLQPCNDSPLTEEIWGMCLPDGTCACTSGHVVNPSTGRCRPAPTRDASAIGEAGQADICTGEYTACGCGCCGGTTVLTKCYYPSLGESIAAITAQDEAAKSSSNCAFAGCSIAVHNVCCAPAAPETPSSATYALDWYSGDLDHLSISKSGTDCSMLSFARSMVIRTPALRISTPPSWAVSMARFGTCGDGGVLDEAKGAIGTLAFRVSGTLCMADLHATLFAFTTSGEVKTSRFDVDGLQVPVYSIAACK